MALPVEVLDDLRWVQLVQEARDRLPSTAPTWTDHNVHDPGITILELLAVKVEALSYRSDQIPADHREMFLRLLGLRSRPGEQLEDTLNRAAAMLWAHERLTEALGDADSCDDLDRQVIDGLPVPSRAVTCADLERVALATPGVDVARARAWANVDLALPCQLAPGTVSVVVSPRAPDHRPALSPDDHERVVRHLDRYRTVGTRVRVFGPSYTEVHVTAQVALRPGAHPARAVAAAGDALRGFLHPLRGGSDGRGWRFGRDVYQSELMAVVGGVPDVDLAASVTVRRGGCRCLRPGTSCTCGTGCGNVCVPAGDLVALGDVDVTAVGGREATS